MALNHVCDLLAEGEKCGLLLRGDLGYLYPNLRVGRAKISDLIRLVYELAVCGRDYNICVLDKENMPMWKLPE